MTENKRPDMPIDPQVKDFYRMAEDFDEMDSREINPSFHSLKIYVEKIGRRTRKSTPSATDGISYVPLLKGESQPDTNRSTSNCTIPPAEASASATGPPCK